MNAKSTEIDSRLERYSRQIQLAELGNAGQRKLLASSVIVVGCGALGSCVANTLTRAGVGRIEIIDRDIIELHNLQRQQLFDEEDVAAGLPKAEAATRKLRKINSEIEITGRVVDLTPRNAESLLTGASLVLDGTDNFETRYLINDTCVKHGVPWIYAGVVGTGGLSMNVLPGEGPCLRCLFPDPPAAGASPTCETAGILGAVPAILAGIQSTEACKLLSGAEPARDLLTIDPWNRVFRRLAVPVVENCPTCAQHSFDYLEARETAWTTTLCGRNAIQIAPAGEEQLPLERLSEALSSLGEVSFNGHLLRFRTGAHELVLFPDGRVIVKGTDDESLAKSLYARYIGR